MTAFTKQALSTDDQLALLQQRGMIVADPDRARHVLAHISYYRLRAYWLPFEDVQVQDAEHRFQPGTDFDTVLSIYNFDRELRLLLLDAIERVEISLRTRLANDLSLRYGPFVHEEARCFSRADQWRYSLEELHKEYARSRETFAEHYRRQYPQLSSPPLWVACELMSLGHLSRWLQNLAAPKDRQAIAHAYSLDERVLVSFIHHLTIVRNHCAHHGRVWNRKLSLKMLIPSKKPAGLADNFEPSQDRRIYNTLTMLAYLMRKLHAETAWPQRVVTLIQSNPHIDAVHMGFPANWLQRAVWQKEPT